MSWPVSRILSLAAANYHGDEAATIHLGTPLPGASSGLPAGAGEQPSGACADATRLQPSWPFFGWGLPSHSGHPKRWCALTAPFHPYHREGGGLFLWHFPASHLGLPLAITLLCEVRTFLETRENPGSAAAQPTHPHYKRTASGGDSANTQYLTLCLRCRRPAICCGPRIWSTPATPRPSRSTIWPRPPGCRGPISAGCSPGRSANPRARICKRGVSSGPLRCCVTPTGRWLMSA